MLVEYNMASVYCLQLEALDFLAKTSASTAAVAVARIALFSLKKGTVDDL
jgi:hypothetical protein